MDHALALLACDQGLELDERTCEAIEAALDASDSATNEQPFDVAKRAWQRA